MHIRDNKRINANKRIKEDTTTVVTKPDGTVGTASDLSDDEKNTLEANGYDVIDIDEEVEETGVEINKMNTKSSKLKKVKQCECNYSEKPESYKMIGECCNRMYKSGLKDKIQEFRKSALDGDYSNLCDIYSYYMGLCDDEDTEWDGYCDDEYEQCTKDEYETQTIEKLPIQGDLIYITDAPGYETAVSTDKLYNVLGVEDGLIQLDDFAYPILQGVDDYIICSYVD